ncbi:TIGR01619 family protein [Bisgaard Taxon 45]
MDKGQSWQNYRSVLNDKLAIFSVNLAVLHQFPSPKSHHIIQFKFPYAKLDENGLPDPSFYQFLISQIVKLSTQLSALPDTLYAGHVLSAGDAQLYFYCDDTAAFLEVLKQFEDVSAIEIQHDPHWDIYFDFLLPSPLEMKIHATEEVLELLSKNGRDLSELYAIEHAFRFEDETNMFSFMDYLHTQPIALVSMQYSQFPVSVEDEAPFYLVKLEQELSLENSQIFNYVEQFEDMANQFSGEYIGWECDAINDQEQLN